MIFNSRQPDRCRPTVKSYRLILGLSQKAEIAIASESYLPYLMKAAASLDLSFYGGTKAFIHLPEEEVELNPSGSDELAYLQFTSGSTRFPRGVMISQKTVMNNLSNLIGLVTRIQDSDRAVS